MKPKNQYKVQSIATSLTEVFPGVNHYRALKRLIEEKNLSILRAFKLYKHTLI